MPLPIVQLHWGWNIFEEGILNLNLNKCPASPGQCAMILTCLNHKIMKISTCFSFWDVHAGVSVWKRGWIGERCFACKSGCVKYYRWRDILRVTLVSQYSVCKTVSKEKGYWSFPFFSSSNSANISNFLWSFYYLYIILSIYYIG